MPDRSFPRLSPVGRIGIGLAVTALASSVAFGLPWDTDMADAQAVKAYSHEMAPPPEGTVNQPNLLTPREHRVDIDRNSSRAGTLVSPFSSSDASVATGARMYGIYCTPCHGYGKDEGQVAQEGRWPGGPGAVLQLSEPGSTLGVRPDGYIFLTVRNGGALMPSYGYAMTDEEIWSIVHYLRTLPANRYLLAPPPSATPSSDTHR